MKNEERKEKSLSAGETDLEVTDRHDGCELMPNAFTTGFSVCLFGLSFDTGMSLPLRA